MVTPRKEVSGSKTNTNVVPIIAAVVVTVGMAIIPALVITPSILAPKLPFPSSSSSQDIDVEPNNLIEQYLPAPSISSPSRYTFPEVGIILH